MADHQGGANLIQQNELSHTWTRKIQQQKNYKTKHMHVCRTAQAWKKNVHQ
jgi:hypothetical protein